MSRSEIGDSRRWRVSRSGYSIKTGSGDETRIVAGYHNPHELPLDSARYQQWLDDAEAICDAHNGTLDGGER